MMVLILHKIRQGLRGRLTRWLIQPQTNVYVGHPSARIRDRIWKLVRDEIDLKGGGAILIHPAANEQGCEIVSYGDPPRDMVDFEGLKLPKTPKSGR